jgi:hypothetical protein
VGGVLDFRLGCEGGGEGYGLVSMTSRWEKEILGSWRLCEYARRKRKEGEDGRGYIDKTDLVS